MRRIKKKKKKKKKKKEENNISTMNTYQIPNKRHYLTFIKASFSNQNLQNDKVNSFELFLLIIKFDLF